MKNLIFAILTLFVGALNQANAAAPVIVTQPESKIVPRGTAASLTVAVQNPSGVTYQWLFNGTPITGKTAATLSFPTITVFDAGKYEVIAHNSSGDTRSVAAFITVADYEIIHSFRFIEDGGSAQAPIVQDVDGKLFGASFEGSDFGGVLFRLDEDGSNYQVLKKFAEGTRPFTSLALRDNTIYFYASGSNAVYAIDKAGTNGRILTRFSDPNLMNGFVLASNGFLYVSASSSEFSNKGRIFRVDPATGQSNVVHQFIEDFNFNILEGSNPRGLIQGTDGALYGVTESGGDGGSGTLFRMELDGSNFRVLKSFEFSMNAIGKLAQDADGNLYGLSSQGGTFSGGLMYRIKPDGSGYTVLHNFSEATGAGPTGGLTIGPDGTLFGLASRGGSQDAGVIFQYSRKGVYQILHRFDTFGSGDGMFPVAPMMLARDGTLYGVTPSGGANGTGVIFKIALHGLPKPPQFTVHPSTHIVRLGDPVHLQPELTGATPMTFQWFKDSVRMDGVQSAQLLFPSVQSNEFDRYYLVASNFYGSATSGVAMIAPRRSPSSPGTLVGWGRNLESQIPIAAEGIPPLTDIIAIAASSNNSVAVRASGTVLAWGASEPVKNVPQSATGAIAVAVGFSHALALREDGTVVAWGSNVRGQTNVPPGLNNVVAITAHADFSAALRSDGSIVAWGQYWDGFAYQAAGVHPSVGDSFDLSGNYALQINISVIDWQTGVTVQGLGDLIAIAPEIGIGIGHNVVVWGDGHSGVNQVPNGLVDVSAVAAGTRHRLALDGPGTVVGWGTNNFGQATSPPGLIATRIAAGGFHSLAIATPDSILPGVLLFGGPEVIKTMETQTGVNVTVERVAGSDGAGSIQYRTAGGSATAGEDYVATSGTLNFSPGQTRATITVPLLDDLFEESPETIVLELSNPTGGIALGARSTTTIEIRGDEALVSIQRAEYSIHESTASLKVRVTRTGNRTGEVRIQFAAVPGSATGTDFTQISTNLIWPDGDLGEREVTIPIQNDSRVEGSEFFYLRLSNPIGAPSLRIDESVVWMIDDETPPVIELSASSYEFAEHDGFATIKILRRGGSSAYRVTARTVNGVATTGQDFEAVDLSVAFGKDDAFKFVRVPLIDSHTIEGDEAFQFQILTPTEGATLGSLTTATVTIHDAALSPEDTHGHRLVISNTVLIAKDDPGQFFDMNVIIFNPGPGRSGPGFLHVAPFFLESFDTNDLRFQAIEPGGTATVKVRGFKEKLGLVYATVYETIDIGNVAQDSKAIYEFFNTAPPSGGVPTGEQPSLPGLSLPPKLVKVVVTGPAEIPGGQTGTYLATAHMDNNSTTTNVTVSWKTTAGSITSRGLLTTQPVVSNTPVMVSATITIGSETRIGSKTNTILAPPKTNPVLGWAQPGSITHGMPLSATQLNATANVAGTFAYDPALGTVLPAGSHNLRATFTPQNTTTHHGGETNVTIVVAKATPAITWETPNAIVYGTQLSGTQLNATAAPSGGAFVYAPAAGTTLNAGPHTLSVTYTPVDTANFNTTTKNVSITVGKANPAITWNNPVGIVYGTQLGSAQLNATAAPTGGAFVYAPAAGATLNAGSQTLSVTYTPADPANYNNATKNVTITVAKADPVITWNNPAGIVYGVVLGGTQLNATAAPAGGTFSYTPTAGTKLNAGAQTLSVTYTPTDTANYIAGTKSVSISVAKATQTLTFDLPAFALLQQSILLNGQASSGLAVSYSIAGSATQSAGTLSFSNVGQVTVTASQGGNENFESAPSVNDTITVIDAGRISLRIGLVQSARVITWPDDGGLLLLEMSAALGATASWNPAPGTTETVSGERRYVVQPGWQTQFYRLRAPQ